MDRQNGPRISRHGRLDDRQPTLQERGANAPLRHSQGWSKQSKTPGSRGESSAAKTAAAQSRRKTSTAREHSAASRQCRWTLNERPLNNEKQWRRCRTRLAYHANKLPRNSACRRLPSDATSELPSREPNQPPKHDANCTQPKQPDKRLRNAKHWNEQSVHSGIRSAFRSELSTTPVSRPTKQQTYSESHHSKPENS